MLQPRVPHTQVDRAMAEPHHRHPVISSQSSAAKHGEDQHDRQDESTHLLRHLSFQEDAWPDEDKHVAGAKRRHIKRLLLAALVLAIVWTALSKRPFRRHHDYILSIDDAQEHYLTIPNTTLQLWYRVWGNLDSGIPLLFVHGGPGNAVADYENGNAQFFASRDFFVVEVDQRGTGESQPSVRRNASNMQYYAKISVNMIADDYELIRKHLRIDKWLVWGGSFGSTVALTYCVRHVSHCAGMTLRGIYLESKREVEEIYARESYLDNPKRLHEFDTLYEYAANELVKASQPVVEPHDAEGLMKAYEGMIRQGDRQAIWHWWVFENNLMEWDPANLRDPEVIDEEDYPQAQSVAFFETRLWVHGTYEAPNHVLQHLSQVAQLPIWICQGLKDEVCPYENAQRLVDTLREEGASQLTSRFVQAGHEQTDPVMAKCLHRSIREFTHYYQRGHYRK